LCLVDGHFNSSTIINLAHALKLKVVAEGVDSDDQLRLLRVLGCDEMQGYLFSQPVPAMVFEALYLGGTPMAVVGAEIDAAPSV
jgi:EAL domain-containing protein (putative c-di-GMP-specific phosphodiesterase class I)